MALNDVIFVKGQGGLGRPLTGEDHYSGILFYTQNSNLPSGFSTTDRIKTITSVEDAENNGILNDYSDATPATATYQVTSEGDAGDKLKLVATEPFGKVANLGTYTRLSSDNTVDLVASALATMINNGTPTHGYSATVSTDTVTITFPKKLGSYPNTGTPLTVTITGDITGTLTLTGNGYHSRLAIWHYHISEFFRIQPKGILYVGLFDYPSTWDFAEIKTMQDFANGKIRQVAVYTKWRTFSSYGTQDIQAIDAQIKNYCDGEHAPLSALYTAKMLDITDLTDLPDLQTYTANKCSVVISQDVKGQGGFLYQTSNMSISTIGATLGAVALATVSQDIAWKAKFNMSNGAECDTVGFANGQSFNEVSTNLVSLLNDRKYIFMVKNVGSSGSYHNDSHTAINSASDYAYIENNRTIDKAIRGAYSSLLPEIASPIQLNTDGTMSDITIAHLTSVCAPNLDQMVRDGDLSNYSVTINPAQDVLSTSKVIISIALLPKGVARYIQVNIGFVTNL